MIGIDILPLSAIPKKDEPYAWRRLGKILCPSEYNRIKNHENSHTLYSIYWAIKESAYKLICKTQLTREFAPKKYVCSLHPDIIRFGKWDTTLSHNNIVYAVQVLLTQDYIFSIAASKADTINKTKSLITRITDGVGSSGQQIRSQAINWLQMTHKDPIFIEKKEYPCLRINGQVVANSISHHSPWAAFSYVS